MNGGIDRFRQLFSGGMLQCNDFNSVDGIGRIDIHFLDDLRDFRKIIFTSLHDHGVCSNIGDDLNSCAQSSAFGVELFQVGCNLRCDRISQAKDLKFCVRWCFLIEFVCQFEDGIEFDGRGDNENCVWPNNGNKRGRLAVFVAALTHL